MDLTTILYGLGATGLFTSRAFVPAFLTALSLRFGADLPFLSNLEFLKATGDEPVWFTHNVTLLVLGALSALEIAADKSPEAQELLDGFNRYLKTGMTALTYMGVVGARDAGFVGSTISTQEAGFLDLLPAALVTGAVFYFTAIRGQILGLLREADEGDDIGLRGLISWLEDLWSSSGVLFLVLFPIVMVVLVAILLGGIFLLSRYLAYREEKAKVECASCGEKLYPSAVACHQCSTPVEAPREIGVLGQSKQAATTNSAAHPYRLVAAKRCPVCATRLESRSVSQTCQACGHDLFAEKEFQDAYLASISRRVPGIIGVCLILSFIPVLGLLVGVVYYRICLVAPFRRYIPLHRSFLVKWLIRAFFLVLIAFQWVPVAGAAVVPIMALVSYGVYRSTFVSVLSARESVSAEAEALEGEAEAATP